MKQYLNNMHSVSVGDRIMVTNVHPDSPDRGDYQVGDFAIVKELEIGGIIVTWESFVSPPDHRQTFLWHSEYRIVDKPELSRTEIIAIIFLIALVVVSFIASITGTYQ